MKTTIRNMRLDLWPIIALNTTTMTMAIRGDVRHGALLSIVISLLASFGFLLNGLWDRDVDRINKPRHFENSDERTIGFGIAATILCLILGMGIASRLGSRDTSVAFILTLGLVAYTVVLRRHLIAPTLLAGFLATSPLWAPLILWPLNVRPMFWVFVVAMLLLLAARETLMDVRDEQGDIVGARDTMATVFGAGAAKSVAAILLIGGGVLLCFVLHVQTANLTTPAWFAAATIICLIPCLVIIPAYRAVRLGNKEGKDHAAIRRFVLRSRAAMAFVPLLNLVLWGK
jgi:4-hydroxybenzoate polyprenyltransferase